MTPARIKDLLVKALKKTLSEAEKSALETWKDSSASNLALYESVMDPAQLLAGLKARQSLEEQEVFQYPAPLNKKDPYQWPHQHDQKWFLTEVYKLSQSSMDINSIEFLYCITATIQHILIRHNALLMRDKDFFTFNWVLDVLSAAYGVPLLPDMPTAAAKEVTQYVLYQEMPSLLQPQE